MYLQLHVSTITCMYSYMYLQLHVSTVTCVYSYSIYNYMYLQLYVSAITCIYNYMCLQLQYLQLHVSTVICIYNYMYLQLHVSAVTCIYSYMYLQLHQLNAHLIFIPYLCHTSATFFGVSHTFFRENCRVPYTKPFACIQLLSAVHRLGQHIKRYSHVGWQYFNDSYNLALRAVLCLTNVNVLSIINYSTSQDTGAPPKQDTGGHYRTAHPDWKHREHASRHTA